MNQSTYDQLPKAAKAWLAIALLGMIVCIFLNLAALPRIRKGEGLPFDDTTKRVYTHTVHSRWTTLTLNVTLAEKITLVVFQLSTWVAIGGVGGAILATAIASGKASSQEEAGADE